MNFYKILLISFLMLFLLLTPTAAGIAKENEADSMIDGSLDKTRIILPSLTYTTHSPIEISSNSEFNSSNGVVSGSGTDLDPYIIEGWNITTSSSDGINIHDTTAYFIIRNCWTKTGDRGLPYVDVGILIDNILEGTAIIEENICINSYYGIQLNYSSNNTVINNLCELSANSGIIISFSNGNFLENNTCNSNFNGITLHVSTSNLLYDNIVNSSTWSGFYLDYSDNNSFIRNICETNENGLYVVHSDYNSFESNLCTDNRYGIYLYDATFNTLDRNTCSNNTVGINIRAVSDYNTLINNICDLNSYYGIQISDSQDNSLKNNYLDANNCGINFVDAIENIIAYNMISTSVSYGVILDEESEDNLIHHNNFINNSESPQACDNGTNNQWYDDTTNEGNYWDDYSGSGDYLINGTASSVDPYPLNEDWNVSVSEEDDSSFSNLLLMITTLVLGLIVRKRR